MDNKFAPSNTSSMSDDITQLAESLRKARLNFKATGLDSQGHNYKYAKLDAIYRAVEIPLADQNITIVHYRTTNNGIEYMHTRLIHTPSGQFIEDMAASLSEKPGNQARGSGNTYVKKEAVKALCGIHQGEDDDGAEEEEYIIKNIKSEPKYLTTETQSDVRPSNNTKPISEAQLGLLKNLLKSQPEREAGLLAEYGIKQLAELPWPHMNEVVDILRKTKE